MQAPFSFSDDYASAFQQQIRAFREAKDMESNSRTRVEDRISQLPDGVLHHILSFVPTKCAVRSSVLSTRWKDMWIRVPNLYLTDRDFSSTADFMEFVDRALLLRDSAVIRKFHLCFIRCPAEDFSRVVGWLRIVVRCNVAELYLSIDSVEGGEMLELPDSLLNCKTLEALKLEPNFTIKIPRSWCCPKLKFLYLKFSYPGIDSMDFSQFPALEYLRIGGSLGNYPFIFNISVPGLKILRISLGPNNYGGSWYFLIKAPKLEKLDVREGYLSKYIFKDTNSLVEASIDIFANDDSDASADRATKFLAGISGVKYLTLSTPFFTACSMPVFEHLSKLTLLRDGYWWNTLTSFLNRSPSLESFDINYEVCGPTIRHRSEILEGELVMDLPPLETNPDYVEELYWSPPESVPKCLLLSLKAVTIKGFNGKEFWGYRTEIELFKYLLKSCQVLEKMIVYTPSFSFGTPEEFYSEISESEWSSRTVQAQLIEKEFYRARRNYSVFRCWKHQLNPLAFGFSSCSSCLSFGVASKLSFVISCLIPSTAGIFVLATMFVFCLCENTITSVYSHVFCYNLPPFNCLSRIICSLLSNCCDHCSRQVDEVKGYRSFPTSFTSFMSLIIIR